MLGRRCLLIWCDHMRIKSVYGCAQCGYATVERLFCGKSARDSNSVMCDIESVREYLLVGYTYCVAVINLQYMHYE